MKKFFRLIPLVCILLVATIMFGCSAGSADGPFAEYPGYGPSTDAAVGGDKSEVDMPDDGSDTDNNENRPQAGQITASAHDDNLYYSDYKALFYKGQTSLQDGKFIKYTSENAWNSAENGWGLDGRNRLKVTVTNDGMPVQNAPVTFYQGDRAVFSAQTNSCGVAYLFGNVSGGKIVATSGQSTAELQVTDADTDVGLSLTSAAEKGKVIEIMLVVDVTGSMGDELTYLKSELADVVGRIATAFTDTKINLALLFYRDDEDLEKFAYSDFLDVTDSDKLSIQQRFINKQSASGGGDYEEAVDEALQLATQKQWTQNSTKIIFHVLDAPPHDGMAYRERFQKAILSAAKQGIRICPVLASGADHLTEYLTRQAAIMTGGTFCYITNHSGIGGDHHDPNIANAVVEKLNDLMVRLVKGYYSGTFDPPVAVNGKTYYNITVVGVEEDFIVSGLYSFYAVGATVTVYTECDETVALYVDGKFASVGEKCLQNPDGDIEVYLLKYTFTMPDNHVTITFGEIPEDAKSDLTGGDNGDGNADAEVKTADQTI